MECVTTVSYTLLINGGMTTSFPAKKGLRQGDPMSPYLFVLVMEYLNRALKKLQIVPNFNYHPKCSKQHITHICFVDDLLLCCRADRISMQLLMKYFEHLSSVSGLKANMVVSSLYISGVTTEFRQKLLVELHFSLGSLPFKYLGVLLSATKLTINQCMPLVEKIVARIFLLPKKVVKLAQQSAGTSSGMAQRRIAAILKLLWAISQKKDTLWVQWIQHQYIKGKDLKEIKTPRQASSVVRKIFEARQWLAPNMDRIQTYALDAKFSIKKAYMDSLPQYPKVYWKSLILSKGRIPKHQFIMWMALQPRLATIDIIQLWGIQVQSECVLCSTDAEETLTHLFFECSYSKTKWQKLLQWIGIQRQVRSWNEELAWLANITRNKHPRTVIIAFIFAATVYHVWMERNSRRFQQLKKTTTERLKEIALQLHIVG
ncbi:uncharacterized protein LOC142175847 [Nicotiana tabacum]|uniref:Uncharacterized protein LOC142175847 n=1 Tax=Nicotiana tabacum TaxID=4097 RepID=A0AC58TNZ3_TOBAC